MTPLSDGTSAHIRIHFIFLASILIVLHFATGRIDAFLRRAYKCGFSKDLFTFQELLHDSGAMLFRKIQSSMHCLSTLLPPKKTIDYALRNSENSYVLPQCNLSAFKRFFINNWNLFTLQHCTLGFMYQLFSLV